MARTRRDGRKGGKRPIPPPAQPERKSYLSSSSSNESSEDESDGYQTMGPDVEEKHRKRKLANKRWKRRILTRKMDHLVDMCDKYERLADDILDFSSMTDHYHVPMRAFHGEWNSITTMQYALESLQMWLAFGEEVSKIGTVSDDPEPEPEPKKEVEFDKVFKITSSSEE